MGNSPNIQGLIADPDFQGLSPSDKRLTLQKVTGDNDFSSLSDAETMQFVSRFQASAQPPVNPVNQAFSGATGIGAAPKPAGWYQPVVDAIKGGLTAAQPGSGLPQQPTALGNAAQFVGMGASQVANLFGGPEAGGGAATAAESLLPGARMARAGQSLNEVSAAIGKHTVPISEGLSKATMYAKQIMESGGGRIQVINDFLKRMTNPELGPLTFDEGREFLKSASKLSVKEIQSMKGSMGAAVKTFASELGSTLSEVADKAGQSEKYLQALKEYGSAARTGAAISKYGTKFLKYAGGGAASSIGVGAGYEFLKKIGVIPQTKP